MYPRYIVVISDDRSVAGVCVGDGVGGGQWRVIMLGNLLLLAEQVVQLRGRPVSGRSRYNGSVFCLYKIHCLIRFIRDDCRRSIRFIRETTRVVARYKI